MFILYFVGRFGGCHLQVIDGFFLPHDTIGVAENQTVLAFFFLWLWEDDTVDGLW